MFRVLLAAFAALWMNAAQAVERPCTLVNDDDFLFERYARAPKVDNGGFFGWKDAVAAARLGLTLKEYVIGGLSPKVRRHYVRLLWSMEVAGLRPAINSAFRDDYRQRMVSGRIKAPVGHSFHGGSKRGGWGHGQALDLVSEHAVGDLKQRIAANQPIWRFVDEHGKDFGVGRPYRRFDPSHLAIYGGGEFGAKVAKRHPKRVQLAKK